MFVRIYHYASLILELLVYDFLFKNLNLYELISVMYLLLSIVSYIHECIMAGYMSYIQGPVQHEIWCLVISLLSEIIQRWMV